MSDDDFRSACYFEPRSGWDGIADLVELAAWSDGFTRGLRFARAEEEAAWPESWRAALRIMRDGNGYLSMHPDDAERALACGVPPNLVHADAYASRGVAFAIERTKSFAWIYDPLRVPGCR